jgi:MoxR-like ATPase
MKMDKIEMPIPTGTLAGKFARMHDQLRGELLERDSEIHGALIALASGTNCLFLGEPGVAKSYLLNRLTERITDVNYFHCLVDNFSGPDALFGPLDLPTLRSTGAYVRRMDGYLPTAHITNIEECFNANESILRALHAAIYEHKYNVDGAWIDIPLNVMFASTNDLPKSSALRAFRDRLLQTYYVNNVQEHANKVEMLKLRPEPNPEPILSWDEVLEAQAQVRQIPIPESIYSTMANIARELDEENIAPSDRRLVMCTVLLQAEAWLDGAAEVCSDHLTALIPALWNTPDQIELVEKVVLEHANPLEKETLALLREVDKIADTIKRGKESPEQDQRDSIGREAFLLLKRAHADFAVIRDQVGGSRRQLGLLQTAQDRMHTQTGEVLELIDVERGEAAA